MQSRTADGTTRPEDSDDYTVKLTCNNAALCGTESFSTTATHTLDGLYTASLTPTVGGTYDVSITMENACTIATSASNDVSID